MRPTSVATAAAILLASSRAYEVKTPPLDTPWTYEVGTSPWPEHPRPQLQRDQWQTLNGVWKFRQADSLGSVNSPPLNQTLEEDVLIPSCVESGLSGIQRQGVLYSWFSTSFAVPDDWVLGTSNSTGTGKRLILNFEAVDYEATVFVNGKKAGFHRGGYWHFSIDVTDYVNPTGRNELLVFVHDPTDSGDFVIPIGKQTLNPSHIFYTPCSGIWQTVWIELVPSTYVQQLYVDANKDGQVNITVLSSGNSSAPVKVSVIDEAGSVIGSGDGQSNSPFQFTVSSPKLWTPDTPQLYNLTVTLGDDIVNGYTGFRTISIGEIDGINRPLLNGEFVFQFGTLDQGFWPDGLYTPPNYEAMVFDLKVLKDLGMNMVRKHIKAEPSLFYRACDELGLLVIQDMPSLRLQTPNATQQAEFARQLELLINQHKSFPSIYTWVVYNEGWGQITEGDYPEFGLTARVKQLDPSRFVDSTSGWFDHGAGDWHDNHHYANPQCGSPFYSIQSTPYDPSRIAIQGEFGGIGHNVSEEHLWKVQAAINTINQTYEIDETLDAYNYRGHLLLSELRDQIEMFACSAAVWTQTTDVEGEVNGLVTYDRRFYRPYADQWKADIKALFDAAAARRGGGNATVAL